MFRAAFCVALKETFSSFCNLRKSLAVADLGNKKPCNWRTTTINLESGR